MTAKQLFEEFLANQEQEGYTLGDITGTPEGDMIKYTELKLAKAAEERVIKEFNLAKESAFSELAKKHDAERIALGVKWQGYEDNNYTVPLLSK
jgi:hypothetical protein